MKEENFQEIIKKVKKNKSTILVVYDQFTEEQLKFFIEALKLNTAITDFRFRENLLNAETTAIIADCIKSKSSILLLEFCDNPIGANGVSFIAEMLKQKTSLKTLILCGVEISDKETAVLANALENNDSLTDLILEKNLITDTGAMFLVSTMKKNKSITSIDLERNSVSDATRMLVNKHTMLNRARENGANFLDPIPHIHPQKGPNCFFYAAAGALEHISKVFNTAVSLPARKRDLKPKSSDSLRSLRKKLDIPGVGPIFKTKEALKVLEATSCNALNCNISSFEQFQSVIETAINNNLPLLIPYSTDVLKVTPQSIHAHWALIFGCDFNKRQKKFLLQQMEIMEKWMLNYYLMVCLIWSLIFQVIISLKEKKVRNGK